MVCSRKKNNKTRISRNKLNLKGGMTVDLDEWEKMNMGVVSINFNLLNVEDYDEISNIININKLDTNIIKTAISDLFESHLDTNNYSVDLDEDTKTQISNWEIQIHLQPENKEFPFLCNLTFVSELHLNNLDLDTVTKVITESESLPLELDINENTYQFNLVVKYSNSNNRTVNYHDLIKKQWENEKEIECGFTNGLESDPRSDFQCYRKLDCKKGKKESDEMNYIKTKYKRDDIKCIPKYSKFNFDNEVIALENNEQTWKTKVDKLCLPKDYISCRIGKNGCRWGKDDEGSNRCVVNPEHFNKRKDLNYY
jgi:hypothetical protein